MPRRSRRTQEAARLDAQADADLALAASENKLANQTMGEVWQSVPEAARVEMLNVQRAWIKKEDR